MPKQMQRTDRFSADEFFDTYETNADRYYSPHTEGSLAVEVDYPDEAPQRRPGTPEIRKQPVSVGKRHIRKVESMARIKSKFNFFLCAGLVMAGCLSVVLMYIQVFNQETQVGELQSQLAEAQAANAMAQNTTADTVTMTDLYTYATGTLGMVEADGKTTIQIQITNQSYTTSNLPIEDASESKVTFHWLGK